MAIEIVHAFTSGKADGSDATLVQPSNWNEAHDFTMATSRVLGRVTGGAGAVEELTAANLASLLSGYVLEATTRTTFQQTAAPTGWTKDTTHNNKAMRLVSGTVSTGGSTGFTSVFTSRTIAQANLPNVNLSAASLTISGETNFIEDIEYETATVDASGAVTVIREDTLSLNFGDGSELSIGGNVPLGGSGTAMDFAVQYVDFIIAVKD